jgi:hypothetical protein
LPQSLGNPLHLFRIDHDSSQHFEILAPLVKGFFAADASHESPHAGREGGCHDVQLTVPGNTALLAVLTVVIGPSKLDLRQDGLERLFSVVHERGQVTLAAVDPVTSIPIVGSEQLLQQDPTHLVHRVAHGHLGCLEIDASGSSAPRQNA